MSEKTILSIVDPTADTQPAVERAAWLAKALGTGVELFICDPARHLTEGRVPHADGVEQARRKLLAAHESRLEQLARPLAEQGLPVKFEARWDRPLDRGIERKIAETRPVLVAKDTHYHSALRRSLLSNTDWNLIRSSPAPLLLVKPRPVASAPRVLAAVDPLHEHDKPAELDKAILAFAKELTSAVHGRLSVLHAYDAAPVLAATSDTPAAPIEQLTAAVEREHREALDALLEGYGISAEDVSLEHGPPHEVLVRAADERGADFAVLGAVSRGALQRLIVGSTAERVLDRLPCDLIIIKPPGFTGPEHGEKASPTE